MLTGHCAIYSARGSKADYTSFSCVSDFSLAIVIVNLKSNQHIVFVIWDARIMHNNWILDELIVHTMMIIMELDLIK